MLEKKFQILLQIMQRTWMYLIHKVFVFSEKVPFITTVVMKTLSENRTFLQIFQSSFYYCKNYQLVITNSSPYQQPKLLKKKLYFIIIKIFLPLQKQSFQIIKDAKNKKIQKTHVSSCRHQCNVQKKFPHFHGLFHLSTNVSNHPTFHKFGKFSLPYHCHF